MFYPLIHIEIGLERSKEGNHMSDDVYNDAKYDMDIYFEEITEYKHHLLRRYLAQSSAFVML